MEIITKTHYTLITAQMCKLFVKYTASSNASTSWLLTACWHASAAMLAAMKRWVSWLGS